MYANAVRPSKQADPKSMTFKLEACGDDLVAELLLLLLLIFGLVSSLLSLQTNSLETKLKSTT